MTALKWPSAAKNIHLDLKEKCFLHFSLPFSLGVREIFILCQPLFTACQPLLYYEQVMGNSDSHSFRSLVNVKGDGKFWQPLFLFTTGLKLGDFIFSFLDRFFDHRWRHYYFLRILRPSSLKLNLMQVSCMGAHSQVPSQFKKRKLGNFCSLHPPQQGIEPGTSGSTSSAFTNVATSTDIGPRVFGWFIYEIWMCFWQG